MKINSDYRDLLRILNEEDVWNARPDHGVGVLFHRPRDHERASNGLNEDGRGQEEAPKVVIRELRLLPGEKLSARPHQSPSFAAGLSRNSERSRIYLRSVLRDLWRACRMMGTSAAPFRNACVAKPDRRLWPA